MAVALSVDDATPVFRERDPNVLVTHTGFYGIELPDGSSPSTWTISDGIARRLGISHDTTGTKLIHFEMPPGKSFEEAAAEKVFEWFSTKGRIEPLALAPGQFYPRIARPSASYPSDQVYSFDNAAAFERELVSLRLQIGIFIRRIVAIFEVIEPHDANMAAFGTEIRNLVILACTEVEAQFRAIMKANAYARSIEGKRLTTNDYVKLEPALRLRDYALKFSEFPGVGELRPFANWSRDDPTASLSWYATYNAIKHDREENLEQATLQAATESIAAVIIIAVAQFGINILRAGVGLGEFFQVSARPRWTIGDCYSIHTLTMAETATPVRTYYPLNGVK